jgi:hypothetical protein
MRTALRLGIIVCCGLTSAAASAQSGSDGAARKELESIGGQSLASVPVAVPAPAAASARIEIPHSAERCLDDASALELARGAAAKAGGKAWKKAPPTAPLADLDSAGFRDALSHAVGRKRCVLDDAGEGSAAIATLADAGGYVEKHAYKRLPPVVGACFTGAAGSAFCSQGTEEGCSRAGGLWGFSFFVAGGRCRDQ